MINIKHIIPPALIISAGIAITLITSCSANSHPIHNIAGKVPCIHAYDKWAHHGGLKDVNDLKSDIQSFVTATNGHVSHTTLQADATLIGKGGAAVLSHMPPACVPGLNSDLTKAVNATTAAASASAANNMVATRTDLKYAGQQFGKVADDAKNYLK